ncbi:MAG: InlB B-repeat-containing protein, partial [Clostridia bacterium]|nr:InlB B-repeat-containing protein [Clostridia bacterium]
KDLNKDGNVDNYDVLSFRLFAEGTYDLFYETDYVYSVIFDYNNTNLTIADIFDKTPEYMHLENGHSIYGLNLPTVANNTNEYIFKGWYIEGTDNLITDSTYLTGDTQLVAKWVPNLDYNEDGVVDYGDIIHVRHWISDGRIQDPDGYNVSMENKYGDIDGNGIINTLDISCFRDLLCGINIESLKDVETTHSVVLEYNTDLSIEDIFDKTPEYIHLLAEHSTIGLSLPSITDANYASQFLGWYIEGTDIKINDFIYLPGDVTLVARWEVNS